MEMGFTLPCSIGVAFADPKKTVFAITGDGSFQLNIQELQNFYGDGDQFAQINYPNDNEPRGSNGFSIAPENTANGNSCTNLGLPFRYLHNLFAATMSGGEGLDILRHNSLVAKIMSGRSTLR